MDRDKPRLDITDVKNLPDGQITQLDCSIIRIGSLKYDANEKVTLSSKGIRIVAPNVKRPTDYVSLDLQMSEIAKVLVHFSKALNVLIVYTLPSCGAYVRKHLEMELNDDKLPYFSPLSRTNEAQRRIILMMERISEESKSIIKNIFVGQHIEEISARDANALLIRSAPRRSLDSFSSSSTASGATNGGSGSAADMQDETEIRKIFLTYPPGKPAGQSAISISIQDYMCLAKDQYLNDVIIEFYLNYLKLEMLEEEERASVHIFSTFFYNRLTTMPTRQQRGNTDRDVKLSAAQKRHARVARWTKRENIFDKKFVIVPINEQSHWFLAIICFPGLDGALTMVNNAPSPAVARAKKSIPRTKHSVTLQIGSTTITPVSKRGMESIALTDDEMCERDEAEGDESELASETEETDEEPTDVRPPIKQPCILIFDSLTGASRSRVVATLRDYLTCEYKIKMPGKPAKVFNKLNMPGHCVKVPQQNNYTDCGLYLLQYVEHFFLEPITDYHLPIKQLQNWFDTITVTKKREDIGNLLKELLQKHNPQDLQLPPIELPTLNGKLLIDPDDSPNDPEFEEEDMEDEEFMSALNTTPDSEERLDTGELTPDTPPTPVVTSGSSLIKPVGSKRTFKIKRIPGQSLVSRSGSGSLLDETALVAAESTTHSGSNKRPLETSGGGGGGGGGNKLNHQECMRPKAPRISDSPNKVVTTQT
uniref:Ubiquitin-like protease family profile domain-containing protein n=1 Tax=Anopheles atroparvus TaxID=41427 RepID=A0AAG5DC81_ANOAO